MCLVTSSLPRLTDCGIVQNASIIRGCGLSTVGPGFHTQLQRVAHSAIAVPLCSGTHKVFFVGGRDIVDAPLVKKSPAFIEPVSPLPRSQNISTGLYLKYFKFYASFHTLFHHDPFNLLFIFIQVP